MSSFEFDPQNYPTDPGCYLMKDGTGKVIYVGKAKNLRKRVSSYFHKGRKRLYIRNMIRRIRDIEVLIVNNETESLILETNLIRRYRPDTNRAKTHATSGHPYIVLTNEEYPRFVRFRKFRLNRELGDEGIANADRRFGPYLSSDIRDTLLDFVNENFSIRTCYPMPKAVCLRYHLNTCGGICEQREELRQYSKRVDQAIKFLSLRHTEILHEMRDEMMRCADEELFIRARKIRDQLVAIDYALEKQIVERELDYDQDVIYFDAEAKSNQALVMSIKQGMLWEMQLVNLNDGIPIDNSHGQSMSGRLADFLCDRYKHGAPKEIIMNGPEHLQALGLELSQHNGCRVQITIPKRGVKAQLLRLCKRNFDYRTLVT